MLSSSSAEKVLHFSIRMGQQEAGLWIEYDFAIVTGTAWYRW